MSQTLPLSIFIICKDEAERLPLVLDALADLSDDLVIVDSGSTDGTLEIARRYTKHVFHRDWEGFGQQKVYAESLCRHDWVLNLDADEVLLEEVRQSIRALFDLPEDQRAAAYSLRIRHVSMLVDNITPHRLSPINITPRLYHRKRAGFKDSAVHDKVVVHDGSPVETLSGDVAHISMKSFDQMWRKIADYARLQAEDWADKGREPGWLRLLLDPPWFFIKNYFLRRLVFLGFEGFVMAVAVSAGRALRIGMTWEVQKRRRREVKDTRR
ncbi:glycosyltransferase family 2 protein [Coralliovum pocilloporae]|uniref:glycosyltransferase family 2 protein n=1 Tax=Coralliovum pocilloporae TaxID=3066369 RepID=UPI00330708AB